jgi:glyoxylase-like metal-dependent hydrolase (beta-lactamase superfamily II)
MPPSVIRMQRKLEEGLPIMSQLTRRKVIASTALAAAFGLTGRVAFEVPSAKAETPLEPLVGFKKYKVGDISVTAVYDGIWKKPHDAAFIKNASIDDVKTALTAAGQTTEFMPIPLTVVVLDIGGKLVMVDSGSGVGQWQPNATNLPGNMEKAGIDPKKISTILVSHFHPDHIFGLMEKGTNTAVFPNAELIVQETEYNWWTEAGRVEKLPEARKGLGTRIQAVFPTWKNFKLVKDGAEVAPGVRLVNAPGHTPGHAAFHVTSGGKQLMVSNDVMYVPALLGPHPDWMGAYDQDGPLAVETRKRLVDRVIAEKMMICGAHFPFPGSGSFVKDGNAYAFKPDAA